MPVIKKKKLRLASKESCESKREKSLRKTIKELENQFKQHYFLFSATCEDQKDILDAMWVLSQRFLILTRGAICVRPYPREPAAREERELRVKFSEKKRILRETKKLTCSLGALKQTCGAFDRGMAKVDASLPNRIVEGYEGREPIFYFIELFADLFKFFHYRQKKLNLLGCFLEADDIDSIMEYKNLLEPDKAVYGYFEKCLHI